MLREDQAFVKHKRFFLRPVQAAELRIENNLTQGSAKVEHSSEDNPDSATRRNKSMNCTYRMI